MKYYDVYMQYCQQKISDYQEEQSKLQTEFEKDNDPNKKTRADELSYIIKAAIAALNELENNRDDYIDDGHERPSRFLKYLNDRLHSVSHSIGFDKYYVIYYWGHPEEYSPNLEWEGEYIFCSEAVSELSAYLIKAESKVSD